jgi:microcystin-dependent protein
MASPPFTIDTTTPGDTDLASIFPANERTFRDVVKSWFLVQGNTNGQTEVLQLNPQGSSPTPGTGIVGLWVDAVGNFFTRLASGSVQQLNAIPGEIKIWAGSGLPNGYLWCNGASVATATYPTLFTAIGYTYGGSGANFNVPDLLERVPVGFGTMGGVADPGRISAVSAPLNPNILASNGGVSDVTLSTAQMAAHNHIGTSDGQNQNHKHSITAVSGVGQATVAPAASGVFGFSPASVLTTSDNDKDHTHAFTTNNTGGGQAHNNMQPSIIVNYIIKY